jgi:hypothetical protein
VDRSLYPMTHATTAPPGWAKILLRTIGIVNLVTVLLGFISLGCAFSVFFRVLTRRHWTCPDFSPYCRVALIVVILLELPFASALLFTAIRFVQARVGAANLYALTVAALIIYVIGSNVLCAHLSEGARIGIYGAHEVVIGSPIDLFLEDWFLFQPRAYQVPFLYPVASVMLVQLIKWLSGRAGANQRATARDGNSSCGSLPLSIG